MSKLDPVVIHELPVIQKIIEDETWLEGERRGGYVASDDPVVQENVCVIVMRIGEKMREMFQHREVVRPGSARERDHSEAA